MAQLSVIGASLVQFIYLLLLLLGKCFPLQGERVHSLKFLYTLGFKNKIERRKRRRRQNSNRPMNLLQVYYILSRLQVHYLTLTFIVHNKCTLTYCMNACHNSI